jgi:PAS domain S-box-containing protein
MHGGCASNSLNGRVSNPSDRPGRDASLVDALRLLTEVSDDVFWVMDAAEGAITYVSSAYERVWKRSVPSLIGSPCEWHGWILAEDRPAAYAGLEALLKEGRPLDVKYRILDGDGHYRWAHDRAWPIRDESGEVTSIVGIVRDISKEKVSEEHQTLLMREMNHRVKNTLATVISIAHQTAASASTLDAFLDGFYARIHAFSGAHDLLMQNAWTSVRLDEVISRTLAHYMQKGSDRIHISGPTVLLPHDPSVALNLVFHELATNAAKYGALSNATGRVSVVWSVETSGSSGVVDLRWEESGGPVVEAEQRRGFGSRLIKRTLAALGGRAEVNFAPSGFDCWIALPLSFESKLADQG